MIGLGDKQAQLIVYIENKPPLECYQDLSMLNPINKGEIKLIADKTGNHWRKIFNVYAKLCFELNPYGFPDWQTLREQHLLQHNSAQALAFSPPNWPQTPTDNSAVHVIMGKGYATKLGIAEQLTWLNEFFAIDEQRKLIICPYFDYRQLSNIKITQLVGLINNLRN
ncbi:MAG: DUF6942 family protein [Thalassotalea sp.]